MPWEYLASWPLALSCSFTCGRKPCTSTTFTPMLWIRARSCAMCGSLPAAMASPAMPTTKVLPRCMWMYGATDRNHGTNVKLKMADIAELQRERDSVRDRARPFPVSSRPMDPIAAGFWGAFFGTAALMLALSLAAFVRSQKRVALLAGLAALISAGFAAAYLGWMPLDGAAEARVLAHVAVI